MRDPLVPLVFGFGTAFLFTTKHYLADFPLQSTWMARGKERAAGWLGPLVAHAGVHAALCLAIVLAVDPARWWLAAIDFVAHAVIDRGKAVASLKGRLSVDQVRFWLLFGFDQYLHQVTNLALAAALIAP